MSALPGPWRPKFCQGFPPIFQIVKFSRSVAVSQGPTISSLPPPDAWRSAWGGEAFLTPATKISPGVPPGFHNPIFFLARSESVGAPSHVPAPPPCAPERVWGGLGLFKAANEILPRVPPVGKKFPNFRLGPLPQLPCAVAPDQGRNAYGDACCMVEAVAEDVDGQ